jgi:hypothetical protein
MIFTPPSDMSEIMQSRGKPPVANCIFAKLLHARRSLLRRFAYMSIPGLVRCDPPVGAPALPKNCWNWPIATARNVTVAFELRLPNRAPWLKAEVVERACGGACAAQFSAN